MRITFVLPILALNGGERVVAEYARHLHALGHQVTVVATRHAPRSLSRWLSALIRTRRWPAPRAPMDATFFVDLPVDLHIIPHDQALLDYSQLPDADVVVATWWETAEWVASLPDYKGAKVYFIQGYDVQIGGPIMRIKATYRLRMKKIVVSEWLANLMRERYGDHDVTIVPNAVDTDLFWAAPRGKQAVPTVGFVHSAAVIKGSDLVFEAVRLLRQRRPELHVRAFGRNRPPSEMPLPPDTHFVLRPPQDKLREIYAACDAWLFPSRPEGFGLPILEAMACRTPVIATPVGAAPQLLGQGAGILVPPESPRGLADAINHICDLDDTAWRRLSDTAFRNSTSYTWKDAAIRFAQVLEAVCERGRSEESAKTLECVN